MKGYSVSTKKSKECWEVTNHRFVTIGDIIDITTDLLVAGCQLKQKIVRVLRSSLKKCQKLTH